jgi:(+)-trans-carveol dehydrogenase
VAGRVEGKVAFITGAARGQGRSHALRLAGEGADIIAVDLCKQVDTVPYPLAGPEDLEETKGQIEALGRRVVAAEVDVRDYPTLKATLDNAVAKFGRLDIVSANAGILGTHGRTDELSEQDWQETIDINLTGAWHSVKAAVPHLIEAGGGSIVLTGSTAGIKAKTNITPYVVSKHGIVGLMRALALELAPHMIRVNAVHPTTVNTEMVNNEPTFAMFRPGLEHPTLEDAREKLTSIQALPIMWIEAIDVSNAVLFLTSDEARYITGVSLPIDAGCCAK